MSTRKSKIKFSIGERVLCYEPDPTKAKVLYDSKILQINITQDNDGRKVPEYLVHFLGWSNNWDRIVGENFILSDTDENRRLQEKLATKAGVCLKGKWKGSFPFMSKGTLAKKEKEKQEQLNLTPTNNEAVKAKESASESDQSDDETEKVVEINIPKPLAEILRNDHEYVTEKKKLVKLPCKENVLSILENYVKCTVSKLLCRQKHSRSTRKKTFNDIESEINFYKEIADGIRIYFDFTLPHLLLYNQEKKQFSMIKNLTIPKEEEEFNEDYDDKKFKENVSKKDCDLNKFQNSNSKQRKCKTIAQKRLSSSENGGGFNTPKLKEDNVSPQSKETTIKSKKPKLIGMRRSLRSSCKSLLPENSALLDSPEYTSPNINFNTSPHESSSVSDVPTNQILRTTLTSLPVHTPLSSRFTHSSLSVTVTPLNLSMFSSSLNSSSDFTLKIENSPVTSSVNSTLLKEISRWNIISKEEIFEGEEPMPSFIYGAHHLLRLFVKFPELLSQIHMRNRKLEQLVNSLEEFLEYLAQKKDDFFSHDHYIDANDLNRYVSNTTI